MKIKGFTLIELMVVIAVITILAMVAYPAYTNQLIKVRRNDARVALLALAQAQERYFTIEGHYASALNDSSLKHNLDDATSTSIPTDYYTITIEMRNAENSASCTGDCAGYRATATPNSSTTQANDANCKTMILSHIGQKSGTADSGKTVECW